MSKLSQSFRSNHAPDDRHEPHPWLEEKVYAKLRQRTIDLVKQSVDVLCKDKQRVSLSTVAAKSRELDSEHQGISEAITRASRCFCDCWPAVTGCEAFASVTLICCHVFHRGQPEFRRHCDHTISRHNSAGGRAYRLVVDTSLRESRWPA